MAKENHVEISVKTQGGLVNLIYFKDKQEVWINLPRFLEAINGSTVGTTHVVGLNPELLFERFKVKSARGQSPYHFDPWLLENDFQITKRYGTYAPALFEAVRSELVGFIGTVNLNHKKFKKGGVFNLDGTRCYSKNGEEPETEPEERPAPTPKPPKPQPQVELSKTMPVDPDQDEQGRVLDDIVAKLDAINIKLDLINGDVTQLTEVVDAAELFRAIMRTYDVKIESKKEE